METKEIADALLLIAKQTLVEWLMKGARYAMIIEGEARPVPPRHDEAAARVEAARLGVELLELNDTEAQTKVGEALMRSALRQVESDLAAQVAAGAGKA
jgi:hypothetical protein